MLLLGMEVASKKPSNTTRVTIPTATADVSHHPAVGSTRLRRSCSPATTDHMTHTTKAMGRA